MQGGKCGFNGEEKTIFYLSVWAESRSGKLCYIKEEWGPFGALYLYSLSPLLFYFLVSPKLTHYSSTAIA